MDVGVVSVVFGVLFMLVLLWLDFAFGVCILGFAFDGYLGLVIVAFAFC